MAMTQDQVEQWIAQHGGAGRVAYTTAAREIDNPLKDYTAARAAGLSAAQAAQQPDKVNVTEEVWEAVDADGKPTGAKLQARRRADGDFDVVSQAGGNPVASRADRPPGGQPFVDDGPEAGPTGRRRGWNPDTGAYDRDLGPSPAAQGLTTSQQQANRPQPIGGTLNTTSPQYGVMDPTTGQIAWQPNPNYQKPKPEPIQAPGAAQWLIFQNPDGTTTTERNPNYQPPSTIQRDPQTGRLIQITQDENGKPVVRPVTDETTIKPAQLPVLQARYGEIAQGLGSLAQQLNQQVADGSMTAQERTDAFTAAHQQAQVQVDELNSILSNSRAIWSDQINQRGQTFGEAASRRSYASSVLGNALSTGERLAESSGPGHGKAIAGGVAALLGMGQQYAQGMGGLPDMSEVPMPRALQQAASVGLPGFGGPSAGPAAAAPAPARAVAPAPAAPAAAAGPATAPRPWTNNETGPSVVQPAAPAAMSPAGAAIAASVGPTVGAFDSTVRGLLGTPAAPAPPPPPQPRPLPAAVGATGTPATMPLGAGADPRMALMGQAMGRTGQLPGVGLPVALGGAGWGWDPRQAALDMLGDGSDPSWAAAVARAYGRPL